jgi:hypothetical protein
MTYRLPVYSDEELAKATSYPPLECGRYRFKVIKREQGTSTNNNPQERLTFAVFHRGEKSMMCFHTFTFNNPGDPGHMFLIGLAKQFLDCIGVEYTPDAFDRVLNREGHANFLVATYTKDGKEREKFVVPNDGFKDDNNIAPVTPTQMNTPPERFDDDIPF